MMSVPHGVPRVFVHAAMAAGCRDEQALEELIAQAAARQDSLIAAVLDSGMVEENAFLHTLAGELGVPWWEEATAPPPPSVRDKIPPKVALRHQLLPVEFEEGEESLLLLTYDPLNLAARQAVSQHLGRPVRWAMQTRKHILDTLREAYGVGADTFEEILAGRDLSDALTEITQETTNLDEEDSEASVVKFVNQIIREALNQRATDLHIEPLDDDLRIRMRIDGVLHEIPVPPNIKLLQASVISRIKIMAHLDIAERRLPQDGRINLELEGRPIDVRVATIPSVNGESVSLRLLGQQRFDFAQLGLDSASEARIRKLLSMPNGIVLVTGPTGCGKSTSLYTFLSSLNTKERRIVTIEDPVEHKLPGVIQIAVKPEINLTFAAGLRSILRGDPNVVMIGEMRDFETAEIAIRAALTGHLVFSTLHTNDAIGGITRLLDMGVEPFLVGTAVRSFLAQRLVRRLCPACAEPATHSAEFYRSVGFPAGWADRVKKPKGCPQCRGTGYHGRMAIYEICMISPAMQDLIVMNKPANQLRAKAMEEGMVPLRMDGFTKVAQGLTSIEEVLRVTASDSEQTEAA